MKRILLLALCVLLAACNSCTPPSPQPVPPPVPTVIVDAAPPPQPITDAAPGPQPNIDASVKAACAAIASAGCPEGGPACAGVMQKALDERLTNINLGCLVGATTKAQVHACGFVVCK